MPRPEKCLAGAAVTTISPPTITLSPQSISVIKLVLIHEWSEDLIFRLFCFQGFGFVDINI
jgi:hypothetical protein